MRKVVRLIAASVALVSITVACAKVPYTGRKQFNLIPNGIMQGLGKATYADMLAESKVQREGSNAAVLKKVGGRISKSANEKDFAWKFALIKEETINAWCLPGGYIGFYTGILPVLHNEAGMAFVMGHEVGHATAHHGAERMSQQLVLLGGLTGLSMYIDGSKKLKKKEKDLLIAALGVGLQFGVILPFSRAHEAEADVIGMMYMSKAGYPPGESIKVWQRMEEYAGGSSVPAFFSTHPSNKQRQKNLKEWLPKARKRYVRNKLGYDTQDPMWGNKR